MNLPLCKHENDIVYQQLVEAIQRHIVHQNLKHCKPDCVESRIGRFMFEYEHICRILNLSCEKCGDIISEFNAYTSLRAVRFRWFALIGEIFDSHLHNEGAAV